MEQPPPETQPRPATALLPSQVVRTALVARPATIAAPLRVREQDAERDAYGSESAPQVEEHAVLAPEPSHGWTGRLEELALHYQREATDYAWVYERVGVRAASVHNVLSFLVLALAALSGTEILTGDPILEMRITMAVVAFLSAALGLVLRVWGPDRTRSQAVTAHTAYNALSQNITYQLALSPSLRQNAEEYVRGLLTEMLAIHAAAPTVPESVKKDYRSRVQGGVLFR